MKALFKTLGSLLIVLGVAVGTVGLWAVLPAIPRWLTPLYLGVALFIQGWVVLLTVEFIGYVRTEVSERREKKMFAIFDRLPDTPNQPEPRFDEFTMARVRAMWREEADKLEELLGDGYDEVGDDDGE